MKWFKNVTTVEELRILFYRYNSHDFIKNIYIVKLNCAMMIGIL